MTGFREYLYISVCIWYETLLLKWNGETDKVTLRAVLEMLFLCLCPHWDVTRASVCVVKENAHHPFIHKYDQALWVNAHHSRLAFNGGSRLFSLSRPPLFSSLLASSVSSHLLKRLSLHGSPNWKIMDLINWSLSEIDTIFSRRSLGSGEPVCPDGTFAAGYTRDAWERWQIVCLAALSVEDAEDIYLFGTMITGILLIGLGFDLGYRKIRKTGTAVQSLTRLPVLKLWEERSALRLRL